MKYEPLQGRARLFPFFQSLVSHSHPGSCWGQGRKDLAPQAVGSWFTPPLLSEEQTWGSCHLAVDVTSFLLRNSHTAAPWDKSHALYEWVLRAYADTEVRGRLVGTAALSQARRGT